MLTPIPTDIVSLYNIRGQMNKVILLRSPGIDSFVSKKFLDYLNENDNNIEYMEVFVNFIETEQRFVTTVFRDEFKSTIKFDYPFVNRNERKLDKNMYMPNRNLIIGASAVALARNFYFNADTLLFSGILDDNVFDNNKEFYSKLDSIMNDGVYPNIHTTSLLSNLSKVDIVRLYKTLLSRELHENPLDIATKTYSCFSPILSSYTNDNNVKVWGCRQCSACLRKLAALNSNEIVFIPFGSLETIEDYLVEHQEQFNKPELKYKKESITNYYEENKKYYSNI